MSDKQHSLISIFQAAAGGYLGLPARAPVGCLDGGSPCSTAVILRPSLIGHAACASSDPHAATHHVMFLVLFLQQEPATASPEIVYTPNGHACLQVTILVMDDGLPVTEFLPGEMYVIESPPYTSGATNCWMHASDGVINPMDPATHRQASSCMMAAYSANPASAHVFQWTAPAVAACVTISVAQVMDSIDNYNTATVRGLPGTTSCALCSSPGSWNTWISAVTETAPLFCSSSPGLNVPLIFISVESGRFILSNHRTGASGRKTPLRMRYQTEQHPHPLKRPSGSIQTSFPIAMSCSLTVGIFWV